MSEHPQKKRPTILCVDDEDFILKSLNRLLRDDYEIVTANSGEEALHLLEKHPETSVAIVDQRMPEMSGVELLEKIRQSFPDVIKIVLTGYTDIGALIDSINKGEAYRYINKPWDAAVLKVTLKAAVERFNQNRHANELNESLVETQKKLKQVMQEMEQLKQKS